MLSARSPVGTGFASDNGAGAKVVYLLEFAAKFLDGVAPAQPESYNQQRQHQKQWPPQYFGHYDCVGNYFFAVLSDRAIGNTNQLQKRHGAIAITCPYHDVINPGLIVDVGDVKASRECLGEQITRLAISPVNAGGIWTGAAAEDNRPGQSLARVGSTLGVVTGQGGPTNAAAPIVIERHGHNIRVRTGLIKRVVDPGYQFVPAAKEVNGYRIAAVFTLGGPSKYIILKQLYQQIAAT